MANWTDIKSKFEVMIEKSEVKNPEFIKTLLIIARRSNTCRNLLYSGYSWDYICYTKAFNEASDALELMNGGYDKNSNKFWSEWKQFCDANDWSYGGSISDWIA